MASAPENPLVPLKELHRDIPTSKAEQQLCSAIYHDQHPNGGAFHELSAQQQRTFESAAQNLHVLGFLPDLQVVDDEIKMKPAPRLESAPPLEPTLGHGDLGKES